jgi:hypothetical protein
MLGKVKPSVARARDRVLAVHMRRRLLARIRPTDVFIVAYPRSGSTWLGYMVAQVLKPDPEEVLTLTGIEDYVPEVNGPYFFGEPSDAFDSLPDPRFFRAHSMLEPAFPKVVYIIRDPRDSLVSHYHYQRLNSPPFDYSLREFLTGYDHWPCHWDDHVSGWLEPRRSSLLLLRYEEMRADPHAALKQTLELGGLDVAAETIERAVQASTFEEMRGVEERFGLKRPAGGGERFVRRGVVGGWRDELAPEDVAEVERRYGDVMERVGYPPETLAGVSQ